MIRRIDSTQISCVVVGPAFHPQQVEQVFASIRATLPAAEIVFSTWEGQGAAVQGYDIVIESPDPGSQTDLNGRAYTVKRQAVSVTAGVRVASRPYVLKLRIDSTVRSSDICIYDDNWIGTEPALFRGKIVTPTACVRNPLIFPQLYSVCDLVQFGLKEDVLQLWQHAAALNEKEFFQPITYRPRLLGNFVGYSRLKCVAEQAYLLAYLQARRDRSDFLVSPCDLAYSDFVLYRKIMLAHFHLLPFESAGVELPKRTWSPGFVRSSFLPAEGSWYLAAGSTRVLWCLSLINKYVLAWTRPVFLAPFASHILFRFFPRVAPKFRSIFHGLRGDRSFGTKP